MSISPTWSSQEHATKTWWSLHNESVPLQLPISLKRSVHEPSGDSGLAGLRDTELTHPAHVPSTAVATWLRALFITACSHPELIRMISQWPITTMRWNCLSKTSRPLRVEERMLHLPNPRVLVPGLRAQDFNLHKNCELSGRVRVWFGWARADVQSQSV